MTIDVDMGRKATKTNKQVTVVSKNRDVSVKIKIVSAEGTFLPEYSYTVDMCRFDLGTF